MNAIPNVTPPSLQVAPGKHLPRRRLLFTLIALVALTPLHAQAPAWWSARQAIDPTKTPADYSAANLGQAKYFAQKAYDQLQAQLPGGAGATLTQLITAWTTSTTAADYSALNLGQLKYIAKAFYDRLAEVGYHGPPLAAGQTYPWSGSTASADYATANLGQLKYLFSFDPTASNITPPAQTVQNGATTRSLAK